MSISLLALGSIALSVGGAPTQGSDPCPPFVNGIVYESDLAPASVTTLDLQQDGDLDIVAVNTGGDSLTVLSNVGGGGFADPVVRPTVNGPVAVGRGDFDGDGIDDVAVSSLLEQSISIHLASPSGELSRFQTYDVGGAATEFVVGDFDLDGDVDLAVVRPGSGSIAIMANDGDGAFIVADTLSTAALPFGIAIGDLNGDGDLDLAVASVGADRVEVRLGQPGLAFAEATVLPVPGGASALVVSDLDLDGDLDLATTVDDAAQVVVLRNAGNGIDFAAAAVDLDASGDGIAAGDVDGDGAPELVVAAVGSDSMALLRQLGGGVFGSESITVTAPARSKPSLADLSQDGVADLVFAATTLGGSIVVELSTAGCSTCAQFPEADDYQVIAGLPEIEIGDVDGDGDLDVVATTDEAARLSVLVNEGDGDLVDGFFLPLRATPGPFVLRDLDADGDLDAAVLLPDAQEVVFLLNEGAGAFVVGPSVLVGGVDSLSAIAFAELTGDAEPDLIVAAIDGGSIQVFRNEGSLAFSALPTFAAGFAVTSVATADFDGDGDVDIAAAGFEGSGSLRWYPNTGVGTFGAPEFVETGFLFPQGPVRAADTDGDGDSDLVVGASNDVIALRNMGEGDFVVASQHSVGFFPEDIEFLDVDLDGDLDFIVTNGSLSLLINAGNGVYRDGGTVFLPFGQTVADRVAVGDLDQDGDVDLVVSRPTSFSVANVTAIFGAGCTGQRCPADVDADGSVDFTDVLLVLAAWGPCDNCPEDIDGGGVVGFGDLIVLLGAWGPCGEE